MKKKLATTLAIAALAPFALTACGGDDDEETPTDTPPAAPQTDTGDTGGGSGGGSTVEISADPGGSLAYEQDSAEADAGTLTISFTNDSSTPHDVKVEGPAGDVGGTDTISGDTAETDVELEAGEYTFYCSVSGHREAGMEGTLTVE